MSKETVIHAIPHLLDPFIWEYRGEGNANIVFSATIPAHLAQALSTGSSHVILRLAKTANSNLSTTPPPATSKETVQFINTVIRPLFPSKYIPTYTIVQVTNVFLNALDHKITGQRPSARLLHNKIDPSQLTGLLSVDYAYMNITHLPPSKVDPQYHLCLEIKPKWLFIPIRFLDSSSNCGENGILANPFTECQKPNRPESIALALKNCSRPVCRFCMHQRYRSSTSPDPVSGFCPLDLLSPATIQHAVTCLLATPNNNLRVWINGEAVPKLSHVHGPIPIAPILSGILTELIPLFKQLSDHQHNLDSLDLVTLHKAYAQVKEQLQKTSNFGGILLDQWTNVIKTYLRKSQHHNIQTDYGPCDLNEMDLAWQIIAEFVLSMTLKDCSILITMCPCADSDPTEAQMIQVGSQNFAYRAKLLDLDPKQLCKVPSWLQMDDLIRQHYHNNASLYI